MADPVPTQATPVSSADVANAKLLNQTMGALVDGMSASSTAVLAALASIASAITASIIGGTTGVTDNRLLRANGTGGRSLQNSAITCSDIGDLSGVHNVTLDTGGGLLTGTTATNQFNLFGYDTGGSSYTALASVIAGNPPTFSIAATSINIGGVPIYTNIPQNSQSAAYSTVLADAQKHILHPTADNNPRTFTIDGSVSYPIGSAITFVNQINTVTIAVSTDTMTLAGVGSTGSRTLAANGIATALKITSSSWIISGAGIT